MGVKLRLRRLPDGIKHEVRGLAGGLGPTRREKRREDGRAATEKTADGPPGRSTRPAQGCRPC